LTAFIVTNRLNPYCVLAITLTSISYTALPSTSQNNLSTYGITASLQVLERNLACSRKEYRVMFLVENSQFDPAVVIIKLHEVEGVLQMIE
jgi:hypothetical protein